jgi:hypothetical protein
VPKLAEQDGHRVLESREENERAFVALQAHRRKAGTHTDRADEHCQDHCEDEPGNPDVDLYHCPWTPWELRSRSASSSQSSPVSGCDRDLCVRERKVNSPEFIGPNFQNRCSEGSKSMGCIALTSAILE